MSCWWLLDHQLSATDMKEGLSPRETASEWRSQEHLRNFLRWLEAQINPGASSTSMPHDGHAVITTKHYALNTPHLTPHNSPPQSSWRASQQLIPSHPYLINLPSANNRPLNAHNVKTMSTLFTFNPSDIVCSILFSWGFWETRDENGKKESFSTPRWISSISGQFSAFGEMTVVQ